MTADSTTDVDVGMAVFDIVVRCYCGWFLSFQKVIECLEESSKASVFSGGASACIGRKCKHDIRKCRR
jgi:hypothetical protein